MDSRPSSTPTELIKSLLSAEPQFPHLSNEGNNNTYLGGVL